MTPDAMRSAAWNLRTLEDNGPALADDVSRVEASVLEVGAEICERLDAILAALPMTAKRPPGAAP